MSQPMFYTPPPRWHFLAAMIGALAIEAAAVAAANLRQSDPVPTYDGIPEIQAFESVPADLPASSPPPEIPPEAPPPPADEAFDFTLSDRRACPASLA